MSASKKPRVSVRLLFLRWHWVYLSENGSRLALSPRGYTRRGDCLKALRRVVQGLPLAEIEIGPGPARARRSR